MTVWHDTTISQATIDNDDHLYYAVASFPEGTARNGLDLIAVRITYEVTTPLP